MLRHLIDPPKGRTFPAIGAQIGLRFHRRPIGHHHFHPHGQAAAAVFMRRAVFRNGTGKNARFGGVIKSRNGQFNTDNAPIAAGRISGQHIALARASVAQHGTENVKRFFDLLR